MRALLLSLLVISFQPHAQTTRWSVKIDSADIFSSPRFVDLNKDGVKDVVIDGKTGELAWSEESGFNQFSPGISVDVDGDGIDEIIYVQNTLKNTETYEMGNQLRVVNIAKGTSDLLGNERTGISMASSPGIVDLENDGMDEIIVATSSLDLGQGSQ